MSYDRNVVANIMTSWVGIKAGSEGHHKIVDIYNDIKPLPALTKMNYKWPWCATTVSAAYHAAGYDAIFPSECSCSRMIVRARGMGIWQEDDAYVPSIGDCVIYDWDDGKDAKTKAWDKTDNQGAPEHVGMVTKVSGRTLTITEGNTGAPAKVGLRTLAVNGRFIRGYVTPKFGDQPKKTTTTTTPNSTTTVPTISLGYTGPLAEFLNAKLRELKYGCQGNTFNEVTRQCVMHYQKVNGLPVTGECDNATWQKLLKS